MPGPFPYSIIPRSDFAAPVCRAHISFADVSVDCDAIIDSGADVTCIPEWMVGTLSLNKVTDFEIEGANNNTVETRGGYLVDFEFLGFPFPALLVASIEGPTNHVLIGRDILSYHELNLSGPSQTFTIE